MRKYNLKNNRFFKARPEFDMESSNKKVPRVPLLEQLDKSLSTVKEEETYMMIDKTHNNLLDLNESIIERPEVHEFDLTSTKGENELASVNSQKEFKKIFKINLVSPTPDPVGISNLHQVPKAPATNKGGGRPRKKPVKQTTLDEVLTNEEVQIEDGALSKKPKIRAKKTQQGENDENTQSKISKKQPATKAYTAVD